MFDTLFSGGTVYDGEGKPPLRQDVGVRDGRLVAIGDLSAATARRRLDLTGLATEFAVADLDDIDRAGALRIAAEAISRAAQDENRDGKARRVSAAARLVCKAAPVLPSACKPRPR